MIVLVSCNWVRQVWVQVQHNAVYALKTHTCAAVQKVKWVF